jgi:hypothetical protein
MSNTDTSEINHLLPDNFQQYSSEIKQQIRDYLMQLSLLDRRACKIAKEHLETSYNVVKSNGFQEWIKTQVKIEPS